MIRSKTNTALFTTLFLLTAFVPTLQAQNGVVLGMQATDFEDGIVEKEAVMEISVLGDKIRFDVADENASVIFDGAAQELTVMEHEKRSYMTVSQEMIRGLVGQLRGIVQQFGAMGDPEDMAELEEVLDALESIEEGTGETFNSTREAAFTSTGRRDTFGGYTCSIYEHREDRNLAQLCMTDIDELEGGREIESAFSQFFGFFEQFISPLQRLDAGGDDEEWMSALTDFRGFMDDGLFPVGIQTFRTNSDGETPSDRAEIQSSERRNLDAAMFEVPEGYRAEMPMNLLMGGLGG